MAGGIVVGTDGSASAMAAVEEAGRLASARGETVHLVSAYGAPPVAAFAPEVVAHADGRSTAEKALNAARERLRALEVPHEVYAVHAPAAQALVDVATTHEASVIVVGSRGMRGARRLLGSVPNAVTHSAPCSVFVVRTD
jgi:nucleotide-binding universal stress UspA family protein